MTDELFADRYKLDRRLGVGGMATVQLAFDTRLERNVAVKLLAEHLAEDASFVSRFRREALAAARLVHPNIVQVFDFGLDQVTARNYIVMEFVDGESCAEILRDHGPLGTRDAVNVLSQACRGLDYAHRNGVVHRDVKPGNLLRSRDNAVKLADFGIAKAAEQSDITKAGSVLGTAAYLSPEQARGEPAGPASDLYALGVVAYQLLAGRLPVRRGVADRSGAPAGDLAAAAPGRAQPRRPVRPGGGGHGRAAPRPRAPLRRRRRHGDGAGRCVAGEGSGARHGKHMGDGRHGGHADAGGHAGHHGPAAPRAPPPPARADPGGAAAPPPGTGAGRRARRRRSAPPPARSKGSGMKMWLVLLLVLALIAGGLALYQAAQGTVQQGVQLKRDVQGQVQDAVDEVKGLIEDNTR